MMENRSYDQMLGALPGVQYAGVAHGTRLPYERADGSRDWVEIRHGAPPDRFFPDPGHGFQAVEAQIYGNGVLDSADMMGFARRFIRDHAFVQRRTIQEYATLYGDGRLPVLHRLAKEFGVCTHWFCSLPSSTTPNRMFAHAGTSGGATRHGAYYARIRGQMIFDKLGTRDPRSWRVYLHDVPHLWLAGDAWTKTFSGHFRFIGAFEHDVGRDQLATYTFIEPRHILPPCSSQHPSAGVSHGERLIADVYNTLASSPRVFNKSLLLVVYDEHGGFYDHVIPPGHPGWRDQCPDIDYEVVRPDDALGRGEGRERGYAFRTLGPRVPAVVVSPWIERGSVYGWNAEDPARRLTFDHTSILATVSKMTGVWVDSKRARAANALDRALSRANARTDYPSRLAFDGRAYRGSGPQKPATADTHAENQPGGLGRELFDQWRAENGDGTPADMVEHFRRLVAFG
jgi:phospholipase C